MPATAPATTPVPTPFPLFPTTGIPVGIPVTTPLPPPVGRPLPILFVRPPRLLVDVLALGGGTLGFGPFVILLFVLIGRDGDECFLLGGQVGGGLFAGFTIQVVRLLGVTGRLGSLAGEDRDCSR